MCTDDIQEINHLRLSSEDYKREPKRIINAMLQILNPMVNYEKEEYIIYFKLNDSKILFLFQCYASRTKTHTLMEKGVITSLK
jgi:hypothetical protein